MADQPRNREATTHDPPQGASPTTNPPLVDRSRTRPKRALQANQPPPLARISTSGPRPLPPPGRARVPRAIPTPPGSPGNERFRDRTAQEPDGETPSLPDPRTSLARISTSGPRPLPPPGRARVPRAIPTPPGSPQGTNDSGTGQPRNRTARHRPYRNQRASWPESPPAAPGRYHLPVGPVSHGPSPPHPTAQRTNDSGTGR